MKINKAVLQNYFLIKQAKGDGGEKILYKLQHK